jgi:hypothetical protein
MVVGNKQKSPRGRAQAGSMSILHYSNAKPGRLPAHGLSTAGIVTVSNGIIYASRSHSNGLHEKALSSRRSSHI